MTNDIFTQLNTNRDFWRLLEGIRRQQGFHLIYGLSGSQKSLVMAGIARQSDNPALVITDTAQRGLKQVEDLRTLCPDKTVLFFPADEVLFFDVLARSSEITRQRLETLEALVNGTKDLIIVAPVEGLLKKLIPPRIFRKAQVFLKWGEVLDIEGLLHHLIDLGYQRVDVVESPGEFALRGGICDIYPPTSLHPVRVELFDNEIDSLRLFDPKNQRSLENIKEIRVGPAREFFVFPEEFHSGKDKLKQDFEISFQRLKQMKKKDAAQRLLERVKYILEGMDEQRDVDLLGQYLSYFYPDAVVLTDYFPSQGVILVDEPNRINETVEGLLKERYEHIKALLEDGRLLPGQSDNFINHIFQAKSFSAHPTVFFALLPQRLPHGSPRETVTFKTQGVPLFLGKINMWLNEMELWYKRGLNIVIYATTEERCKKIQEFLFSRDIPSVLLKEGLAGFYPGQVMIAVGILETGFIFEELSLAVITENEIFGQRKKTPKIRPLNREGEKIRAFTDLEVGDYVVHVNHGIGKYLGLEKLKVGEIEKDYLVIKYAGEDRLYVPTDQIKLIQKYIGGDGAPPKLYRLGGNEWNRVKSRVKASLQEMAGDLLSLYAAREAMKGYGFSPDTPWQKEFEDAFPYTETPDQLQAINDVKHDMEKPKPMDRLLCGDVGYGKTEVAIRAAFKAVADGKQVAVLVPTTILAQQHYNTFRERFADYPIVIEVLSRFRSPKEQKSALKRLKIGQVDIVIGTHRLLSDDVVFKDLGLLIIDEEQRFGVTHKEKLKQLRKNVDVLTLTATPIPRTLHMSLIGIRDMSIIETPPEDRYPVQTYIVEDTPELIREAIRRELKRGGQVYFVHNRIMDIDQRAAELSRLVPEARIAVAHGQMREEQLEDIMLDFMEKKFDVLVCTTIIETGLDISNVNTLIVNEADQMGLAQLYQLRGRVGRSNRLAYAYLTFRKDKTLSEVAEKRLNTIREFTELGSGFKIAMRDLEIRGTGNLLGAEQHGHMAAVGFDLYCRLLEQAVRELKGEQAEEPVDPAIDLKVDAHIPVSYIGEDSLKMEFYQRLLAVNDLAEIEELREEMEDRFGPLPPQVENLLTLCRFKQFARELGIRAISQGPREVRLKVAEDKGFKGQELLQLSQKFKGRLGFAASDGLDVLLKTRGLNQQGVLDNLEKLLLEMKSIAAKPSPLI